MNVTSFEITALQRANPKKAAIAILLASAAVLAALLGIIYGHPGAVAEPAWISWLPALNASLNGTSAVFLLLAVRAVRRRQWALHARRVLMALGASTLFLVSYVTYHWVHGDTKFLGHGVVRPIYFFILISHIVLSAVVLPLILATLFLSLSGRFSRHKSLARYTFPVWLYVSVTGVLVFGLLRIYG